MLLSFGELAAGAIDLGEAFFIIMIGAEFFLPMRTLGSYFHIAMNGVAAAGKMFRLFDLQTKPAASPAAEQAGTGLPGEGAIRLEDLSFAYEADRPVLKHISLEIPPRGFIALVGASGSGKSTVAAVLSGQGGAYTGHAFIGGREVADMETEALMKTLTLVRHNSRLFAGTVRDNLLMGKPGAGEAELEEALEWVGLREFLETRQGLDTVIQERAANLSGGQQQRLALARALLHDTAIYIFDEVSSNIDVESEERIMEVINALARKKTVLLITHRLANALRADKIAVLDQGVLAAFGKHGELLEQGGIYSRMYREQRELEAFARGERPA
jgi:ABC-type transport system involved in cytochrome bd biosynthesis fused ATPase/permease subunit